MDASLPIADKGVSDREAEVLALIGDHLTNAQIAGRLFISVRTVESHVSSLLHKVGVPDRRALADLSGELCAPGRDPSLPTALTSFVGRATERAALTEALAHHRLVTAIGPGGVGKTRLATAVAEDVAPRYAGRARYVDLVPVTDPAMVGAALATAFGFGEQPGRTPTETVIAKLAGTEVLVLMDNCEHLLDGVTGVIERLLACCPQVTVLATSRARLRVPFEYVFPLSGLSLDVDAGAGAGGGDATALFCQRAAMTGWSSPYEDDHRRISAVCARLDGVALAIELAAARVATIGLDGLVRGLADPLTLLTGGPRLDERHRSVRSALDWSVGLLDDDERAAMRRAAVFAGPFTASTAAEVTGFDPLSSEKVAQALATLADHSLVLVVRRPSGTWYRILETIRQYGAEQMDRIGEEHAVRTRHLAWCLATVERLQAEEESGGGFDEVADDLRAGLGWAAGQPALRAHAHQLAAHLARLAYSRGLLNEAQERFEESATLAAEASEAAEALHLAAAVAWGRHAGNEAIRLLRAAAEAARRAGQPRRAALELVSAAELITNAPGIMSELAPPGEELALLAEGRVLAAGDPHFEAAVLTVTTAADEFDPTYGDLAERAVELAHRVGDARLESHALDQVTAVHLVCGEYDGAVATVRRRLELLAPRTQDVEMAWEHSDALHMAPLVCLAAGALEAARRYAQQRSELPIFRESDHLAVEWLLATAAIAGDLEEATKLAQRFRRGWLEAGRPPLGGIGFAPSAAAMACGIRGDEDGRLEWLEVGAEMRRVTERVRGRQTIYSPTFDAMVALHRGEAAEALGHLSGDPESFKPWHDCAWRPWYTAAWAEAGVLGGLPDRRSRLDRARYLVRENPVAAAIVERASAVDTADLPRIVTTAATLEALGCRYQQARSLVLAGGEARLDGQAIMAEIGASPMALV
jgi:predicted ATPase/DNA-binding CsgD family transcriptional regulator